MYIRIILFPLSLSFATNYYHLQRDLSFEERSSCSISINDIPRRSLTASPLNYKHTKYSDKKFTKSTKLNFYESVLKIDLINSMKNANLSNIRR